MQGQELQWGGTRDCLVKAVNYFEKAIELDPIYSRALAGPVSGGFSCCIFSLVSADMESSGQDEDEKVQILTKEQSLIEEQPVEEEKEDMKKPTLGPPKKCPDGHRHISWSMDDDRIFCWDCNQRYPLLACFRPPESNLSESEEPNDSP